MRHRASREEQTARNAVKHESSQDLEAVHDHRHHSHVQQSTSVSAGGKSRAEPAWHEQYDARMTVSEGQRSMKLRDWPVVKCGDKMALRPLGVDMIFGHFYAPGMIAKGWDGSGPVCLPAAEAFIKHTRRYRDDEEQECERMAWDLPDDPE